MIFECPECGARVRGGEPGSIVACGRCSNPLVVPDASAPSTSAPSSSAPSSSARPPARQSEVEAPERAQAAPLEVARVWRTAGTVVLILALAHVGLFLLLTMDARAGMREIGAVYPRSEIDAARRPGVAPEPGTTAFSEWSRSVALWDKAAAYEVHARQVMLLRTGLLISFLVLLGVTGWALLGILRRRPSIRSGTGDRG